MTQHQQEIGIAYILPVTDGIEIRARADPDGSSIGDFYVLLHPSESFYEWSYQALLDHGAGQIEFGHPPVRA